MKIYTKTIYCLHQFSFNFINLQQNQMDSLELSGRFGVIYLGLTKFLTLFLDNLTLFWNYKRNKLIQLDFVLKKKIYHTSLILQLNKLFTLLIITNIIGVAFGYFRMLEIKGFSFRAYNYKHYILLFLGYSKGIKYKIPNNVKIRCFRTNIISIFGINKQLVNNVSEHLRLLKKINIYKGKGLKYFNTLILLKEGKKQKK